MCGRRRQAASDAIVAWARSRRVVGPESQDKYGVRMGLTVAQVVKTGLSTKTSADSPRARARQRVSGVAAIRLNGLARRGDVVVRPGRLRWSLARSRGMLACVARRGINGLDAARAKLRRALHARAAGTTGCDIIAEGAAGNVTHVAGSTRQDSREAAGRAKSRSAVCATSSRRNERTSRSAPPSAGRSHLQRHDLRDYRPVIRELDG